MHLEHNPQPQSSRLFPYTTLFRSRKQFGEAMRAVLVRKINSRPPRQPRLLERQAPGLTDEDRRTPHERRRQCRDRKSTRLNSSHTVISYAVFCLKKKKVRELRVVC